MKRILNIMAVCAFLFVLTSCGNGYAQLELKKAVIELDKQCPIDYDGITCVSASVEDDFVVIHYVMDDGAMQVESLFGSNRDAKARKAYASMLVSSDKEFANKLIAAGYGFRAIFKGDKTKKEIAIELSNAEFKDAIEHPLSLSEQLSFKIAQSQATLPLKVDEITLLTELKLEGDDVCHVYEIDDEMLDFSAIAQDAEAVKESLREEVEAANSPTSINRPFITLVRRTNKNLCYIYHSKSTGNSFEIKFTNSELRQIANDYIEEE